MPKSNLKKYLWQLFIALVPVPLTILLTVLYIQEKPRLDYLEYLENVNNGIIDLPSGFSEEIELFYSKQKIKNLSSSCYRIFNWSNKNYSKVNVYVKFDPNETKSAVFTLVKKVIKGPEGFPQYGFKEIQTDSKYVIGWEIDTINMSSKVSDCFQIDLLFLDEKVPQSKLCVLKEGLNIRPWDPLKNKVKIEVLIIGIAGIVFILYAMIFYIIIARSKKSKNQFIANFQGNLKNYYSEKPLSSDLKRDPETLCDDILEIYKATKLKSSSKFDLFIKKLLRLE